MIRKLSVASIASNFTKRSGSMASLHKTAEDDESAGYDLTKYRAARAEQHSNETILSSETEDLTKARLSIIQDERENLPHESSSEKLPSFYSGPNASPAGTMRPLTTLSIKKSWGQDGQRIITPPLRTSSANSLNVNRTTSLSTVTHVVIEEKENIPQSQATQTSHTQKLEKRTRGRGKSRSVVAEGIRNLFR